MSGNGYGYYYPSSAQTFPVNPTQAWSEWALEQQQYNNSLRNSLQHPIHPLDHPTSHPSNYTSTNRSQSFYNTTSNRHYQQQQRRYPSGSQPYSSGQPLWHNNYNNKRSRSDSHQDIGDHRSKAKKKKKPLSQNVPSKKEWTMKEAEEALATEKDYNKRFKNHSLIIKFPDQELNRDIVSKFHPSIENVHFQQPSTPRFCFVTLQESANADSVITELNKIKFGDGHLTAEYKKDREEDQNISPEDIDPTTLYVGNLAQEITKDDMVKAYPKQRRIDIGYAKKMKYTRYAFVSFYNVSDSIEAFKTTHSTQMYSKSLIVRFRRLHGTVGMPGESKGQTPAKKIDSSTPQEESNEKNDSTHNEVLPQPVEEQINTVVTPTPAESPQIDLSVVKHEISSSDDEDGVLKSKTPPTTYKSPFMAGSIIGFEQHRPIIKEELKEDAISPDPFDQFDMSHETIEDCNDGINLQGYRIKEEANDDAVKLEQNNDESSEEDENVGRLSDINFSKLLHQIDKRSSQIDSLRKLAH